MQLASGTAPTEVCFDVGRFGHPFFEEQLGCAPPGFAYKKRGSQHGVDAETPRRIALDEARFKILHSGIERVGIRALSTLGYVRQRHVDELGCPLLHSAQQLVRDCKVPYVVDFECVEVFSLYQRRALEHEHARRRLMAALTDASCRFLLPWSAAARRGLETLLGGHFAQLEEKTITVQPAVKPRATRAREREAGPLRLLFIGTAFEAKGGVEALRAVALARKNEDVVLDVLSDIPTRWRAQIEASAGAIRAHPWPASSEKVLSLFRQSDALLFPSHMDTLGFVILEAMAHGLPVIATEHFATPELVEDEVSGLIVGGENGLYAADGLCRFDHTLPPPASFRRALQSPSAPYTERLGHAIARLAADPDLHRRLATGALLRVTQGALSVQRRQDALGRLYRRALAA